MRTNFRVTFSVSDYERRQIAWVKDHNALESTDPKPDGKRLATPQEVREFINEEVDNGWLRLGDQCPLDMDDPYKDQDDDH